MVFGVLQTAQSGLRDDLVLCRPPRLEDGAEWIRLRSASKHDVQPWEPLWPADALTLAAWQKRVKLNLLEIQSGQSRHFHIFRQADNVLVGGISLSQIRMGFSQSAVLGYWIGSPFHRKGYGLAAARLVVAYGFERLKLHRITASCMAANTPSLRLLDRLGFIPEGIARGFLQINGAWEDHVILSRLRDD